MSVSANAALITTFAKPGQGNIGDVYEKAYKYSSKVQEMSPSLPIASISG